MTANQIAALKFLIIVSKPSSDLAKRIAIFLIDNSYMMTKEVCLTLIEGLNGYNRDEIQEAAQRFDGMMSMNCTTHLDEILLAMNSELHFDTHYGHFDPTRIGDPFNTDGMFAGLPASNVPQSKEQPGIISEGLLTRYTFWLSKRSRSRSAQMLPVSREILEVNNLKLPKVDYYWNK